jgi:hypothetical protein
MNNEEWPPSEGEVRRRLRRDEQDRLTRDFFELTSEDDISSDDSLKDSMSFLIQHVRRNDRIYTIAIGVLGLLVAIAKAFL